MRFRGVGIPPTSIVIGVVNHKLDYSGNLMELQYSSLYVIFRGLINQLTVAWADENHYLKNVRAIFNVIMWPAEK